MTEGLGYRETRRSSPPSSSLASERLQSSDVSARRFLAALWDDWGSRVTGPLSVPLTIFAFYAPTAAQKTAWGALAATSVLIASYRVWAKEYSRRSEAEAQLSNRRPRLVFGCDWTFSRGFSPSSTALSEQMGGILGPGRDYYSPYYVRNDGGETGYNVSIELPSQFSHLEFLVLGDYPPDGQPRALHIRVGQHSLNYDLAEALRDSPGVMDSLMASVNSSGVHELRVPVRISYSTARGESFTDEWEIAQRSHWSDASQQTILHDGLVIRFRTRE
jgi:hypothetical protein